MGRAFVTGATGFLGRNLVHELSERGWSVTALVRDERTPVATQIGALPGVALAQGELTLARNVLMAVPEEVDVVFHCAADTSTWSGHQARQEMVNIEGTRNIIHATYESRAQVLVHVSTASVWGGQKTLPYDETTRKLGFRSFSSYVRTKYAAEHAVMRAVERGLEAVIVNPGHIMGPYDTHNWASLIRLTAKGALPGIPPGSGCFTDAHAVVCAMIRAAEVGKSGENYLLGGNHASFQTVVQEIASQLGVEPPAKRSNAYLLDALGRWNNFTSRFTRKPPSGLTREAAWFVSHRDHFVSTKAEKVLGYAPAPLDQVVSGAIAWQVSAGHLYPPANAVEDAAPDTDTAPGEIDKTVTHARRAPRAFGKDRKAADTARDDADNPLPHDNTAQEKAGSPLPKQKISPAQSSKPKTARTPETAPQNKPNTGPQTTAADQPSISEDVKAPLSRETLIERSMMKLTPGLGPKTVKGNKAGHGAGHKAGHGAGRKSSSAIKPDSAPLPPDGPGLAKKVGAKQN